MVLGIAGNDTIARERPVVLLTNRDDLTRIPSAKVMKRIETGNAGDTGDEKWERRGFLGAGDHAGNCTQKLPTVSYQPAARRRATNAA